MPITKEKPMRTISQCGQCGESFNGMVELKDHIRKVHIPDRIAKFSQPVVEDKPKIEKLNPEFAKITEPAPIQPAPLPNPIVLEYRYKGQCPTCLHEVQTIMMDIEDYSFAVCYCSFCNKKLLQTKVIPISSQGQK